MDSLEAILGYLGTVLEGLGVSWTALGPSWSRLGALLLKMYVVPSEFDDMCRFHRCARTKLAIRPELGPSPPSPGPLPRGLKPQRKTSSLVPRSFRYLPGMGTESAGSFCEVACFGVCAGHLRAPWRTLGPSESSLRAYESLVGRSWGLLGGLWGPSWTVLGPSWAVFGGLGRLGALLWRSWVLLGASCGPLGALLGTFWDLLGPLLCRLGTVLGRLGDLLGCLGALLGAS